MGKRKVTGTTGPLVALAINRQDYLAQELIRTRKQITILNDPLFNQCLRKLENLPAWKEEVEDASLFMTSDMVEVEVTLKKDLAQPALLRQIVSAGYAHKLRKQPRYDNTSLMVTGRLFEDVEFAWGKMRLEVTDYLPQTCTVTYEEVTVPARTEKRAKIVCQPTGSAEPEAIERTTDVTEEELAG